MAKLYRVIPDTISTLISTGYRSDIAEDLLYKMGYLSYGDHSFGYFGTYEEGKGMSGESTKDYIFFFSSPWSCIRGLNFFNDPYGHEVARILEYDIPDEIVKSSKDAFTNYTNYQAKGKKISVELLKKGKEVFGELSDELQLKLEQVAEKDATESIEQFCQSVQRSKFSALKNKNHINEESLSQFFWESSRMQRINNRRFQKSGSFFRTDIVTGKCMVITRTDREIINDILSNEKEIDDLSAIINKSNGILTLESFKEYDGDAPEHPYGMILE